MKIFTKHQNIIFYAVTIVAVCAGLFLWVSQGKDTKLQVEGTNATVDDLTKAVKDLQADHDGQDALAVCLGKLIIASQKRMVTDVEFETCVITTSVPARTDEDTEPADPTGSASQSPDNQSSVSSSSSNSTPQTPPRMPDNSQTPQNPVPTPEPEESPPLLDRVEDVVCDLPLVPCEGLLK